MGDGSEVFGPTRVVDTADGPHELSALTIGDWAAIRSESLQHARREYIKTFSANADLVGAEAVLDATKEAALWTYESLGTKPVEINDQTRNVEYGIHWTSSTVEGQTFAVWRSVLHRHPNVTLTQVRQWCDTPAVAESLADVVGQISQPRLGKHDAPAGATRKKRKKIRRKRVGR